MRSVISSSLVLALAAGLAGSAMAQKESKAVAEVRKLNDQFIADLVARDVDKAMSHYWNNADLVYIDQQGKVLKGWEAGKKAMQGFLESAEAISLTCPDAQSWHSGEGVLSACAYKIGVKVKGEPQANEQGWYTNYRRKIGGKWLIVFEHVAANAPPPPQPTDSLYKRLGGYDALAAVSDDFLGRLAADKELGRFFQGVSKAHQTSIRQHVVDFLCMATGGPCVYVGRDMKSTHAGLGISGADWERMVGLLLQTCDKFSVPPRERKEVLAALGGLKADIVDKP